MDRASLERKEASSPDIEILLRPAFIRTQRTFLYFEPYNGHRRKRSSIFFRLSSPIYRLLHALHAESAYVSLLRRCILFEEAKHMPR